VFSLALRQAEGFLRSLCAQLELDMPIPDHSTLSRRAKKLGRISLSAVPSAGPIHLVIDSTGLRMHTGNRRKPPDQRLWRKLHIAVNESTEQVTAAELTASDNHDSMLVDKLLKHNPRGLVSFTADGAYDTEPVYEAVAHDAEQRGRAMPPVLIPPRKGALLTCAPSPAMKQRNRNLRAIGSKGRRAWHKTSGYSRRSRVENVNCRYKATFGPGMRARSLAGQRLEARLGCRILNRMAQLGMPRSMVAE
jgi:Transposase DDE domain